MAHISANQWRTSVLKACVGAYVARGVAEDIADACVVLLSLGRDPLPELLPLIGDFSPDLKPANWAVDDKAWTVPCAHILVDGPSVVDLAETGKQVRCQVDDGLLLFGLCTARHLSHESGFDLMIGGNPIMTIDEIGGGRVDVAVQMNRNIHRPKKNAKPFPIPTDENWDKLQRFAAEILVPADETNRADAGAGLTDND